MRKTIFDSDLCPVIPSPHESLLPGQNCFPVSVKTFSAHVKSKKEHDVREKRFNTHAILRNFLHASIKKLHHQDARTDLHPYAKRRKIIIFVIGIIPTRIC